MTDNTQILKTRVAGHSSAEPDMDTRCFCVILYSWFLVDVMYVASHYLQNFSEMCLRFEYVLLKLVYAE